MMCGDGTGGSFVTWQWVNTGLGGRIPRIPRMMNDYQILKRGSGIETRANKRRLASGMIEKNVSAAEEKKRTRSSADGHRLLYMKWGYQ